MGQWNVKPFLTQAGNILQIVLPGIRANLSYTKKRWISLLVMVVVLLAALIIKLSKK